MVPAAELMDAAKELMVIAKEVMAAAVALVDSAGGGMMLKLTEAPQSWREVPLGQQPASVQ
jgi:hypothetical protein